MRNVYLVRCGDDHYKVGISSSVRQRVRDLQTGNPNKIEIISTVLTTHPERLEAYVHSYLAQHRTEGGTEWFKLSPAAALDIAALINSDVERGPQPGPRPAVDYLDEALVIFQMSGRVSVSLLQRKLGIGYAKGSKIVDELIDRGQVIDHPNPMLRSLH